MDTTVANYHIAHDDVIKIMETFTALLAICAGNSPVPSEFPTQRPVTRSFDVSFGLRLNKWLSKQWWYWWFETLSCPLWRHCNAPKYKWHVMHHHIITPLWNTKPAQTISHPPSHPNKGWKISACLRYETSPWTYLLDINIDCSTTTFIDCWVFKTRWLYTVHYDMCGNARSTGPMSFPT